ncbi:precorrin-3B C(17)-methyltransferase [Paraburkholderia phosphatilytica]|uniref:precorrin-3B C(17)-methyltransferase n=1 Tax=Paraburkholderia phosphatilytica TaxID=2282883 RepID=UPI000E529F9C|nr:precorrin-3B C(17)-methyltransferase [Paraburkholderia phosphatilytica]
MSDAVSTNGRADGRPPAIVVLGAGALVTARRVRALYAGAQVHGLQGRIDVSPGAADVSFSELGEHLRALYASGTPVVALCAAGIVIRCVAPLLANKGAEPPVLALAEDGSAVVPLLGGLAGVNAMAREIAAALGIAPAITTSGELRFGTCLLNPPEGYVLASLEHGKRFVSDLLAGQTTRIDGDAPWLDAAQLPRAADARLSIGVSAREWDGNRDELRIYPRSVVVAVSVAESDSADSLAQRVRDALAARGLSERALAALLAAEDAMDSVALADAARLLEVPLRFVSAAAAEGSTAALLGSVAMSAEVAEVADVGASSPAIASPRSLLANAVPAGVAHEIVHDEPALAIALGAAPIDPLQLGRARGSLTVIGLGPGAAELLTPAARAALDDATDILGYATYVAMAGPLRAGQQVHASDNREELQRARHAFELAAAGRRAVVVSSGDPGVFAMAAAVLEALDTRSDPRWEKVELHIVPGVSAAMATAAVAGAPLGHDFCMLSLSDNLKPWDVIERRLRAAAEADLVMAFYNPVSKARPWQLDQALDIVRSIRSADTCVVLGRNVGRPGATLRNTTLGALRSSDVDMRTMVIVGSSTTRVVPRAGKRDGDADWVYTPRWYR